MKPFHKLFPQLLTCALYLWTGYITITRVKILPIWLLYIWVFGMTVAALYTYFKVIRIGAGVPMDFKELQIINLEDAEHGIELPPEYITQHAVTLKHDGRFRFCRTCNCWKPDRCHHCSSCDKCILKMDHHCPWFAECVGFKNQKFFIQFLLYTTGYAIIELLLCVVQFTIWFRKGSYTSEIVDVRLLLLFILSFVVTISMLIFSGFTIFQLLKNQTTIEMYGMRRYRDELRIIYGDDSHARSVNLFDLGSRKENWCDVMGYTWFEWCLPVFTNRYKLNMHNNQDKGLFFRINNQVSNNILESANLQDRLLRRVTPKSSLDMERPLL